MCVCVCVGGGGGGGGKEEQWRTSNEAFSIIQPVGLVLFTLPLSMTGVRTQDYNDIHKATITDHCCHS